MPTCRQYGSWLLATVALGCGGGGSGPGPTPSVVLKSAGDAQIGPAGSALAVPLEVTVKDGQGNVLAGINVAFAVASGGGSVAPASTTTGADGKASATRTLGPNAGTQTTTATVTGVTPASFSSIATIQGAVTITASGSATRVDTVKATAVPALAVLVKDPNGVAVPGIVVTWSVSGHGHLSQLTDTTDVAGMSSVTWTFDSIAGDQTASASVTGLVGSPFVFTGHVAAGNAVAITTQSGDLQAAAVSAGLTLSVVVLDSYGNGKAGVAVAWAATGGGMVSPTNAVTDGEGQSTTTRTLGSTPGVYATTATLTGVAGSPVSFSDTAIAVNAVTVGPSGTLTFAPKDVSITAGEFVKFTWGGGVLHNVTWDTAPGTLPLNSPTQSSGSFTVRLTDPGAYTYHCTVHGAAMSGSITAN